MADDTRRKILDLLRDRELTATQVSEELGKTPQAIYHHLRKLLEGALIEVAKEERIDHCIEAYYRATAQIYELTYGEKSLSGRREARGKEALQTLVRVGVAVDEVTASKCDSLIQKIESIDYDSDIEERIAELDDLDLSTAQWLSQIVRMLFMSDGQFEELQRLQKEVRELLKSGATGSFSNVTKAGKQ